MGRTGATDAKGLPQEPGHLGGRIGKRAGPWMHPVVTVVVDEITAAEKADEPNGGTIVAHTQPIGDGSMGWMGYFKDREGNVAGLYQWPKKQRASASGPGRVTPQPSFGGRSVTPTL